MSQRKGWTSTRDIVRGGPPDRLYNSSVHSSIGTREVCLYSSQSHHRSLLDPVIVTLRRSVCVMSLFLVRTLGIFLFSVRGDVYVSLISPERVPTRITPNTMTVTPALFPGILSLVGGLERSPPQPLV